jgi:hypothetical protein
MPDSDFASFQLYVPPPDGVIAPATPVAGVTVKCHDATNDVPLAAEFESDADGVVAGGTLPVAAGTRVIFRCENDGHGRCAMGEQTTT